MDGTRPAAALLVALQQLRQGFFLGGAADAVAILLARGGKKEARM